MNAFVARLPGWCRTEIGLLLTVAEHLVPALALRWGRLSTLPVAARQQCLQRLADGGPAHRLLYRGLRDLCMVGYYQRSASWPDIRYWGPWVDGSRAPSPYDALAASRGALPRGWRT